MNYYINKTSNLNFDEAVSRISTALSEQGFGILTEIDMKATLKKKLDEDIRPYKILGACNPVFASKAIKSEEKIGILLPCNVTIIENESGKVDISVIDPSVAMSVVENPQLISLASEIKSKLENALATI